MLTDDRRLPWQMSCAICLAEKFRDGGSPSPVRKPRTLPTSRNPENRNNLVLDWLSRDFDVFIGNVNVNFRSNAKLSFEVDSRLNLKTNSGNDSPRITRLEIVDVHAVAVGFLANGMAGPMRELFAKTCA